MTFKEFFNYDSEHDDPAEFDRDPKQIKHKESLLKKGRSVRRQSPYVGVGTNDAASKFLKSKGYTPSGEKKEKTLNPRG